MSTMMRAACASLCLAACSTVHISDNVGPFELDLFEPRSEDELHMPYVAGGRVSLSVSAEDESVSGWRIAVDDPEVLALAAPNAGSAASDSLSVEAQARRAGETVVRVLDANDDERASADVEVHNAEEVRFFDPGTVMAGRERREGRLHALNVLEGGEARVMFAPFADGKQLYGLAALSVSGAATLGLSIVADSEDGTDEVLLLRPTLGTSGSQGLGLAVNGIGLAPPPLRILAADEVTGILTIPGDEGAADGGDLLGVLARGLTAAGERVLGLGFTWHSESEGDLGAGDLLNYRFSDAAPRQVLVAQWSGQTSQVAIHGSVDDVTQTSEVTACTAVPVSSLAALVALGWLVRRRRAR